MKVLTWDGTGTIVIHKKLDAGRFELPRVMTPGWSCSAVDTPNGELVSVCRKNPIGCTEAFPVADLPNAKLGFKP